MFQSKCKYCGAAIFFAFTKNGKRIPMDEQPVHCVEGAGNEQVWQVINDQAIFKKGMVVSSAGPNSFVGFRCHFGTCENRPNGRQSEAEYRSAVEEMKIRRAEREAQKQREKEAAEALRREKEEKEAADRAAASRQYSLFSI